MDLCTIPSQVPSSTFTSTPEITVFDRQDKIGDFPPLALAITPSHPTRTFPLTQKTLRAAPS